MNITQIDHLKCLKQIPEFYQQVILSFNKCKESNKPSNFIEILDSIIWGNKHFLYISGNKEASLYAENWINSGIIYFRDIKFLGSRIDENFLHTKIANKSNIFREMYMLKKALKPYRHLLVTHQPIPNTNSDNQIQEINLKTKQLYNCIKRKKTEQPFMEKYWLKAFNMTYDKTFFSANKIYTFKVKMIKEKKLAEFNFKVLSGILMCGKLQKRFKIKDDDKCVLCDVIHDIPHLLYYCKASKLVWEHINQHLHIMYGIKDVIAGVKCGKLENFISTILCYYIYKYWLLNHDKENFGNIMHIYNFFYKGINERLCIYHYLNWSFESDALQIILQAFKQHV